MAEYWKSTPSYWCKFCSTYVRDTGIERKNHEASTKHQNAIQRNLRELQKSKQIEEREKQRAKDEVSRLNSLVSGRVSSGGGATPPKITGLKDMGKATATPGPALDAAAQRKAHAEQLLALGVDLPEELKQEVQGIGSWQTVSERVVDEDQQPKSLAEIKQAEDSKQEVNDSISRGVHKRTAVEDADDTHDEQVTPKRKTWGSNFKTYPDSKGEINEDLDSLLNGVAKKKPPEVKKEASEDVPTVKEEVSSETALLDTVPDVHAPKMPVTSEAKDGTAPIVFKKRKIKR